MIYKNALLNGEIVDIKIENGKFAEIGHINEDGEDLGGKKIYPGLIDVHIHGCMGNDASDIGKLPEMSEYLAKNGVTSWLPTTMTIDIETIKKITSSDTSCPNGAEVLGFHMEGPYISPNHKGAQNEKYIKNPDIDEFLSIKNVKMITLAPEREGSMEFIKKCPAVVSIGHTDADYDCTEKAIDCGAKCLTHTFNAMPPLHHRNPGVIGAGIDREIYAQVICDGLHIHKSVIKMLYRTFGKSRMVLISDALRAAGLANGVYELGKQNIIVKNSIARTEDGALAGGTTMLLGCVKKAIEFGIPEEDAFCMASRTPAELMGLNKGRIEVGFDADFGIYDNELNLQMCVVGGKAVYKNM